MASILDACCKSPHSIYYAPSMRVTTSTRPDLQSEAVVSVNRGSSSRHVEGPTAGPLTLPSLLLILSLVVSIGCIGCTKGETNDFCAAVEEPILQYTILHRAAGFRMRRSPAAEKLQLHTGLVQHLFSVITPRLAAVPGDSNPTPHPLDPLSANEVRAAAQACKQHAAAAGLPELRFNAITLQVPRPMLGFACRVQPLWCLSPHSCHRKGRFYSCPGLCIPAGRCFQQSVAGGGFWREHQKP